MSLPKLTVDTEISLDVRDPSLPRVISPNSREKLDSLENVLEAVQQFKRVDRHQLQMMRTAAGHLAEFLNLDLKQIHLDQLITPAVEFKKFLKNHRYKCNAIRSYVHYLRLIVKNAEALGWKPRSPEIPAEWKVIYDVARKQGCGTIVRYAIENRKRPMEFGDADLDSWGAAAMASGRTHGHITTAKHLFRRAIFDAGHASLMPRLTRRKGERYGVPVAQFPAQLRSEVEAMIAWKQSAFISGVGRRTKLRDISADNVRAILGRLYGHALTRGKHPRSLEELVAHDVVNSFADWYINQRKLRPNPLRSALGAVYAAITQHRHRDVPWFSEVLNSIPKEPKSAIRKRKETKWVDYDVIAEVSAKIRAAADCGGYPAKKLAMMRRDELLIKFISILPWRQRNLREPKLGARADGANIFKERIPQFATFAKPEWALRVLQENPHMTFWQAHFEEPETKTHKNVDLVLPRDLIPLLEDWVQNQRPVLVREEDPGTLFVNSKGRAMSIHCMTRTIGELTLRYTGRRVTPHILRDIFSVSYLKENPEGYFALSKILWHSSPKIVMDTYGANLDESYGVLATEEWQKRRKHSKQ